MNYISPILRSYSSILFTRYTFTGLVILLTTFWHSNIGMAGLIAAITGMATIHFFNFSEENQEIHILNSLLVGLSLGLFFQLNIYLLLLLVLSAIFTVFLSISLADILWRFARISPLSLPFIIISVSATYVARDNSHLEDFFSLTSFHASVFNPWLDMFFSSIGATFFTPHPLMGLIIFFCILIYSRYLAFLACSGYIAGFSVFVLLADNPQMEMIAWSGFNFILTAIALGGIYTIPSLSSFSFAMLGACMAALVSIPVQKLLITYGLPVMALPFVLVTMTLLIAIRNRHKQTGLALAPEPGPPEINHERSRLSNIRQGGDNSVPLLAPFYGDWCVYQGFHGKHTHRAPWQHALDFIKLEDGKSYSDDGINLTDYYCYGAPVISPVYGTVVRVTDNLPDNAPGELDTQNNWGNLVLIRLESGLHVLLAHLCEGSIKVKEGEWIKPGTSLGKCGNSGRSPQPHLHLQVQQDARLGSPTVQFHLCSIVKLEKSKKSEYMVIIKPHENDIISPAEIDTKIAYPMHFPVGRTLRYRLEGNGVSADTEYQLRVEVAINGQFRIVSDSGASIAFSEANGVIAFYDRSGPYDLLIDIWTLCLGLTPLTESATVWKDSPSARLLPLSFPQRLFLSLIRPLGAGLESLYNRTWQQDKGIWLQSANHKFSTNTLNWNASTVVKLDPRYGCIELELEMGPQKWRALLTETGLTEDTGIPGWQENNLGSGLGSRPEPDKNDSFPGQLDNRNIIGEKLP